MHVTFLRFSRFVILSTFFILKKVHWKFHQKFEKHFWSHREARFHHESYWVQSSSVPITCRA